MRGQLRCLTWVWALLCSVNLHAADEFEAPPEAANEFHFVVLGDAQFHDTAKFNRIIDQVRRLRPAFVIQVGDLIEGYQNDLEVVAAEWQRFNDQVAPLAPVPFVAVPGNHDIFNADRQVDPRLEDLFVETWGPLYFAFDYQNATFIALNTDSSEGANQITGKQLDWLQKTLASSSQPHKFVFMHRPPFLTSNAEQLHELFKQYGVSHVFYGHHHHYHFFERDGVAYIMTNAAATSVHDEHAVGGFHHLLQVAVRDDEVAVAVIEADAIKAQDAVQPEDNYDFFELDQRLAPDSVRMQAQGETQFEMALPLRNNSRRDIRVYVSCTSADERWQILPKQVKPLELPSKAQQTITLSASFNESRVPESMPSCELRVPFQTGHGEWIEFSKSVQGLRPTQR